jgi:hypothetical protein
LGIKLRHITGLAFPNRQHLPPATPELAHDASIASRVAQTLLFPVIGIGHRRQTRMSASVHVPEASMNVDNLSQLNQYDIRRSRKVAPVQTKTVAEPMD